MVVTQQDIQQALRALYLQGQIVCLHSSLRSFGHVAGGAVAVLRAFLDEGITILVPTFSSVFEVAPLRIFNLSVTGGTTTLPLRRIIVRKEFLPPKFLTLTATWD